MLPAPRALIFRHLPHLLAPPPYCRSQPSLRSLLAPWGFTYRGGIRLPCVSASTPLCVSQYLGIFWCLVFLLGGRFGAREKGQGASTPWQSSVPFLPPPLLGHAGAVQANYPPPPPSVIFIPYRLVFVRPLLLSIT